MLQTIIIIILALLTLALLVILVYLVIKQTARIAEIARLSESLRREQEEKIKAEQDCSVINEQKDKLNQELTEAKAVIASLNMQLQKQEEANELLIESYKNIRAEFEDKFKAIAGEIVKVSGEDMITRIEKIFKLQRDTVDQEIKNKQESFNNELVKPIKESLKNYEDTLSKIEINRREISNALRNDMKNMQEAERILTLEASKLVRALRTPHGRGNWGELQLDRVVELAGMTSYCDYNKQEVVANKTRPDMIINLPNHRRIIIDSKTPIDAYLNALECESEEERKSFLKQHARQIREQVKNLSNKKYWDTLDQTPDFVIMFIPSDIFLSEALRIEPSILADALQVQVVPATPATLFALLRAVAFGWRQEHFAEDAKKIIDEARELHNRLATAIEHAAELGTNLSRIVKSYNKFAGSIEQRVMPSIQRLEAMEVKSVKSIRYPNLIEGSPREIKLLSDIESESKSELDSDSNKY